MTIHNHNFSKKERGAKTLNDALLEAQFETSPDGILVVDQKGRALAHNALFGKMWTIPKKILSTDDDKKMLRHVESRLKDPTAFIDKVNYLYKHRDERSFDRIELKNGRVFSRYSSPIRNAKKQSYGRIWYFRDITEGAKAQQDAIANDIKFQAIFENTADPIYILDEHGVFVEVNRAACRQSGYSRRQLLKMSALDISSPLARPTVLEKIALAKQKGAAVFETEHLTASGETVPIEIHASKMAMSDQSLIVAICRDMTKNRRIRDLKRIANMGEKKFKTVFDSAGDAIFILPGQNVYDKKFIEVNRTACEKLGYGHDEFLTMTPRDMEFRPREKNFDKIIAERVSRLKTQGVLFFQLEMRAKDGRYIPFELISRRANYYGQAVLVCVARDITDVKKIRELQELKTLQNDFLNITTHELRTPLTSIIGLSEIIGRDNNSLTPKEREYLNIIHEEGQRLARTIKQVLEVTRYENRNIPVNVSSFRVDDLAASLKPILEMIAAGRNAKISITVNSAAPTIATDREKITQIVFDLVDNAVKFGPEGQTVTVAISRPKGKEIMIAVADQGPGIPKNRQSEIFKKFGQIDTSLARSQEGIGLGLYTAKMIIEALGGKIGVKNGTGKGATFWFTLPV